MSNNTTLADNIFNDYMEINITNLTHINNTYIINLLERFPKITFGQSFLMTFLTLMGDETFILLILLSIVRISSPSKGNCLVTNLKKKII